QREEGEDVQRPELEQIAAPAAGEVEIVGREPLGEIPPQHRRLEGDAEQGREIEMRRAPERAQRAIGKEEQGHPDAEENAVIFGENGEAEGDRRGVEPAIMADLALPAFGEDEEQMRRQGAEEDEEVV